MDLKPVLRDAMPEESRRVEGANVAMLSRATLCHCSNVSYSGVPSALQLSGMSKHEFRLSEEFPASLYIIIAE